MPGMGGGRKGRQQAPQRKKSKSGNPAKRAAEERAAAQRAAAPRQSGAAFGQPAAGEGGSQLHDLDHTQLPKGFEKFLGR
jgi:signal recognition particle subunit SRP54